MRYLCLVLVVAVGCSGDAYGNGSRAGEYAGLNGYWIGAVPCRVFVGSETVEADPQAYITEEGAYRILEIRFFTTETITPNYKGILQYRDVGRNWEIRELPGTWKYDYVVQGTLRAIPSSDDPSYITILGATVRDRQRGSSYTSFECDRLI